MCTWVAWVGAALVVAASGACTCDDRGAGRSAGETAGEHADRTADPTPLPALSPLPMGKQELGGFAYSQAEGRAAMLRALAAERKFDWEAVEAGCREVLAADPGHLEASWHLALALARQKRYAEVAAPLSAAVAGDWMRWGERSLIARALGRFRDTPYGRQWADLALAYRATFRDVLARSLLVIGRRGRPWYPREPGAQPINHRSELYAYDFETERFLRVSRTNGSLVGYLRTPDAGALIYASYRNVVSPARGKSSAGEPARPDAGRAVRDTYIRELRIGAVDLVGRASIPGLPGLSGKPGRPAMSRREVVLEDVAWAEIGFADADGESVLVARVGAVVEGGKPGKPRRAGKPGKDRAAIAIEERRYRLDIARGRAIAEDSDDAKPRRGEPRRAGAKPKSRRPAAVAIPAPSGEILRVEYDLVQRFRTPVPGVLADWDDRGAAGAFRLDDTRRTVALPGGLAASGHSMRWSPSMARLAFATVADEPCGGDREARRVELFAVDAATGVLRDLAVGEGDLAPLWIDDVRLAYVDNTASPPSVRVVDAHAGTEVVKLASRGGVNTDLLGSTQACRLPDVDPEDRELTLEDLSAEDESDTESEDDLGAGEGTGDDEDD